MSKLSKTLVAIAIVAALAAAVFRTAEAQTYLGDLSANKYDPNSVSNPYGQYGSKYSPTSARNSYATNAPQIHSPPNGGPPQIWAPSTPRYYTDQ